MVSFKITNITYDTYDEEAEEHQTQEDLGLPTEMVVQIELQGDEEEWEIYDLLTYQIENQGYGWLVESFDFDTESKSAESAKDSDMMGKRWAVYHTTIPQEWLEANRRPSGGYPHHEPTLDISHQFYGDDRIAFDPQWYEQVATATFNEGYDGELLWRLTNNVDESWSRDFVIPNTFEWGEMKMEKPLSIDENGKEWGLRSSMIGDIFHDLDNNEMWIVADFGFEKVHNPENKTFNVEFNEWADQEMKSHGKDISFQDWSKDEGLKHGNSEITDWAKHEDKSHIRRFGAGLSDTQHDAWGGTLWPHFCVLCGKKDSDRFRKGGLKQFYHGIIVGDRADEFPIGGPFKFAISTGTFCLDCVRPVNVDSKFTQEVSDGRTWDGLPRRKLRAFWPDSYGRVYGGPLELEIIPKKSAEELKRDSCCCGATKTNPCACMIQGIMKCSATCPCSLEKNWGGDPKGKLALALQKSRDEGKKPKKPLKIEKLDAESWGETNQATMEHFLGYSNRYYPTERIEDMVGGSYGFAEEDIDWLSLRWYLNDALTNGNMMSEYGEDNVKEALEMLKTMNAETSGQWEIGEQLEEAQMNAEIDGEELIASSANFSDGSMIVGVGTETLDVDNPDFMEMMIDKDGKIEYFTLPIGLDGWDRHYNVKPSHYGKMKTQNETNESAGGDFIRTDGEGKYAESFAATKGIDTFTQPFEESSLDSGTVKSVLVGLGIGALALFGYNKWK